MKSYDAALFDIRCVLFDPDRPFDDQPFAARFAREQDIKVSNFVQNPNEFQSALAGERELAEVVAPHLEEWRWDGSAEELIRHWCSLESKPSQYTLKRIRQLRESGVKCYLTANQTREQTESVFNGPLKDTFDGSFPSHELGAVKPNPEYYVEVLKQLGQNGVEPRRAVLFERSYAGENAVRIANITHRILEQECCMYESPDQALAICGVFPFSR